MIYNMNTFKVRYVCNTYIEWKFIKYNMNPYSNGFIICIYINMKYLHEIIYRKFAVRSVFL